MMTNMQGLVEDDIYVSQNGIQMSGGDAVYQWICAWRMNLPRGLINQRYPQINRSEASIQIY